MKIYKKSYSDYYDILYKDKNYESETDFIANIFDKYSLRHGKKLLSLGCGTCNYEILLAKKGYSITGLDKSVNMLNIAEGKIKAVNMQSKIDLFEKDVRAFSFKKKFDQCMAMFNIVGYQIKNEDFEKTLTNINRSLVKGGVLIFDCWYLPAVLMDKPKNKIKKIKTKSGVISRFTKSLLHVRENVIEINFDVIEKIKGKIVEETNETHMVRYWSLPETLYFLNKAGFELLNAAVFMNENKEISENNWDMFIVARKKL